MKKRVLFITTKNLDYIRNVQEIKLLKKKASDYAVIGSCSKSYPVRLLIVYFRLLFYPVSRYDLIWIGFAPQLVLPFFWRFRGKVILIDFFISLYDTLCCDRKKVRPGGLIGKWLHLLDEKTLERADRVICDTKAHRQYFEEEFQIPSKKFLVLYLEADREVYYPRSQDKEEAKQVAFQPHLQDKGEAKQGDFLYWPKERTGIVFPSGLKDRYVVLYFGSVLPLQGVDIVLKAMDLLKGHEKLFFFFIGPLDHSLKKLRPISDNICYINWLSQEKLAEYIGMADLCLAGHFNKEVAKASRTIPGKAFIFQAMGKRMVLGDNPANREVFGDGGKNSGKEGERLPGDGDGKISGKGAGKSFGTGGGRLSGNEEIIFVKMGDENALAEAILAQAGRRS